MDAVASEHLAETLQHLYSHWESQRGGVDDQGKHHAFTIAISREAGTQGAAIARETGRILGWQVYDHELLECIAKDMGLRTSLLQSVDERNKSWLLETAEAFMSAPGKADWGPLITESAFVHRLVKTVLALGVHGECVIVGRGAPFILPPATTVRARLTAPAADRIATLGRNLGISEREAARRVRAMDRERAQFVQDHFFKNPSDAQNFDLVVNVSRLTIAECAELIVAALRRLQTHGAEKSAGGMSLRT